MRPRADFVRSSTLAPTPHPAAMTRPDECESDGSRHGSSLHDVEMPGVEPASLTDEHAREQFVVLQPKCLNADNQAFESERDRIADDECDDADNGQPATADERRRGGPHKSFDRSVHQPERGETCERDEIGTDPESRYRRCRPATSAAAAPPEAASLRRPERQEPKSERPDDERPPRRGRSGARRCPQRGLPNAANTANPAIPDAATSARFQPAFAISVDGPHGVAPTHQHRTKQTAARSSNSGLSRGRIQSGWHNPGRPEELPEEDTEEACRQTARGDERPCGPQGGPAPLQPRDDAKEATIAP